MSRILMLAVVSLLPLAGCRSTPSVSPSGNGPCRFCDRCSDIPDGAIPNPLGTTVCRWHNLQAAKANEDDFVIYNYEFSCDTAELGPFGRKHLLQLNDRLFSGVHQVVVQPSDDPDLSVQRRIAVVNYLEQLGHSGADSLVVVRHPIAEGLLGTETEMINDGLTAGQNGGGNAGSGGGGRFGGGGLF